MYHKIHLRPQRTLLHTDRAKHAAINSSGGGVHLGQLYSCSSQPGPQDTLQCADLELLLLTTYFPVHLLKEGSHEKGAFTLLPT